MKHVTITLPDELEEALEAYQRSRDVPMPLATVTQAALREYLAKRGFLAPSAKRSFRITPAKKGSGARDVGSDHDRHFVEADKE